MKQAGLIKKLWDTTYDHLISRSSQVAFFKNNPSTFGSWFGDWNSNNDDDLSVNIEKNLKFNTGYLWKALDFRATDVARHDWKLYHIMGEDKKREITEHVGINLFYKVNEEYTEIDIWKYVQNYYDLFGEAFLFFDLDSFRKPISITPITADMGKMTIECNTYGQIVRYILRPSWTAEEISIDPYQMLYYQCKNPGSSTKGMGLMNKILREAKLDRRVKDYMISAMENFGSTSLVVSIDKELNEEQFNAKRKVLLQSWTGSRKARLPFLADLGTTVQDFGQTAKELDFNNSIEKIRDQIIQIAGTPPYLYGIKSAQTRADALVQKDGYMENTIHPLLDIRDQRFSQDFWNKYYNQNEEGGRGGYLSMESVKTIVKDYDSQKVYAEAATVESKGMMDIINSSQSPEAAEKLILMTFTNANQSDVEELVKIAWKPKQNANDPNTNKA